MSDDLEDLKRRLVVARKRDGRSVYDETAKADLGKRRLSALLTPRQL
jgi:hypothetical protein